VCCIYPFCFLLCMYLPAIGSCESSVYYVECKIMTLFLMWGSCYVEFEFEFEVYLLG
jgi:hypothetical protein